MFPAERAVSCPSVRGQSREKDRSAQLRERDRRSVRWHRAARFLPVGATVPEQLPGNSRKTGTLRTGLFRPVLNGMTLAAGPRPVPSEDGTRPAPQPSPGRLRAQSGTASMFHAEHEPTDRSVNTDLTGTGASQAMLPSPFLSSEFSISLDPASKSVLGCNSPVTR